MIRLLSALLLVPFLEGCLKVTREEVCPAPVYINQSEILKNPYGKYLGSRPTFPPTMKFNAPDHDQNCILMAACDNIPSQYENGYLMMFRTNGPPVFWKRYFEGAMISNRSLPTHLTDLLRDKGENKDFRYMGPIVDNPTFACQAYDSYDKCSVPKLSGGAVLTTIANRTDTFTVQCPSESGVFLRPSNSASEFQIDDEIGAITELTCVAEGSKYNWYFNSMSLGESFTVECRAGQANNVSGNCRKVHYVTKNDEEEYGAVEFMKTHQRVDSYKIKPVALNENFQCLNNLTMVLFSWSSPPLVADDMQLHYDRSLTTSCKTSPITSQFAKRTRTLYALGRTMPHLGFACIDLNAEPLKFPAGYDCPMPRTIDQAGISARAEDRHLAARPTVDPIMRLVTQYDDSLDPGPNPRNSCVLEVSCVNMPSEYKYGYLMMFRTNGPPVFLRRFYPGGLRFDDKFTISEVMCFKDGSNTKQWRFIDIDVANASFACQADDSYGKCTSPVLSILSAGAKLHPIENISADTFKIECPASTPQVWLLSSNHRPIKYDEENSTITELTCVLEPKSTSTYNWYYNNVMLKDFAVSCKEGWPSSRPAPWCRALEYVAVKDEPEYGAVEFMEEHQRIDEYSKLYFQPGDIFSCDNQMPAVLFSTPPQPMIVEGGAFDTRCVRAPLAAQYGLREYSVYVFGQFLPHLGVACYDPNPAPSNQVPMGKCQCPPIHYIDQEGVKTNAKYLGERQTVRPTVRIGDECQMAVSCETADMDDFYFMIFRENGPPIFNRRFTSSSDKTTPFRPTGLECVQKNGQFEWQYFGGTVTNISFALQSNADMCKCPQLKEYQSGRCDTLKVTCDSAFHLGYFTNLDGADIALPKRQNNVVDEITCAKQDNVFSWFYGGIKLSQQATARCGPPVVNNESFNASWHCGCTGFVEIATSNNFLAAYNADGRFDDYTVVDGSLEYSLSVTCTPTFECISGGELYILSTNYRPMKFEAASPPTVNCQMTPLATDSSLSSSFWYVGGVMLVEPAYACLFLESDT